MNNKRKSFLNVGVAILFKILILIVNILVRRFLIQYAGNAINGLNSLYVTILDFLSVAELGVGSAITFCMYKPIVEGDNDKVSALYGLFTKLYLIIGGIIALGGCAVMPALGILAKGYEAANVNLYSTFALMLLSIVLSYGFSAKSSLINAYKDNYITTAINSAGQLLQCVVQILVIIYTKSFVGYLLCRVAATLLQWVATEIVARYKHGKIISTKKSVDGETKKEVTKNIKAMFMHKIGYVLVNAADSLIISAFIGIDILGKYSNYTTIAISMMSVLTLCFTPLTSIIGHMCVAESKEQSEKYFDFFHAFNFVLGIVFFLGYYAVIDNLVTILFADNLQMAKSVSFVITMNYFIQFMRQAVLLFRDATGMFYYDRWKALAEGLVNIVLSILFVMIFPKEYNVVGVIVATIITNLLICHVIEPHILYKYAFGTKEKKYYFKNYAYIFLFAILMTALNFSMVSNENQWIELFANGGISLAYSLGVTAIIILINKNFRHYLKSLLGKFHHRKNERVVPQEEQSITETQGNTSEYVLPNDSDQHEI